MSGTECSIFGTLIPWRASVAAYKLAKKTGNNRAAAGKKKNFAQRHPVLTGVATGMVVHKVAKDSGKHKK